MADPLSISSSIVAILQLTGTVVQYLSDAKGASKDHQRILTEISSTTGTLYLLKDLAERAQWEDGWSVTIKSLNLPGGPLEKFRMILVELALKLAPAHGVKKFGRALIWPFQKEEIDEILTSLERQKTVFSLALQNDHIGLSQAIKSGVTGLHDRVDKVSQELNEVRLSQAGQESHLQSQQSRAILAWLSPLNFPTLQSDLIRRRQKGTGEWIFQSIEFKTWLNGTRVIILCPGCPGAGKTMLAAIVVDYLSKTIEADDVGIAYIYCTYRNRLEQTPTHLLASLLKQSLQEKRLIPDDLVKLHKHHTTKGSLPILDDILKILRSEMNKYSKFFVVVDAIDECTDEDDSRQILLRELKSLQTSTPMNLMVTTRPILKIERSFQEATRLEIRASSADVQQYIEGHMSRLASCVARNINLQETIKIEIVKAVDGMFLLAQLHLDSLSDKTSPKVIRKALEQLPRGSDALDDAYNEAMERINNQKPGVRDMAKQVLAWITYAARPLTIFELQHALAVEPGESELDEENFSDVEELVSACAGLVTVDQASSIVRLVHYTTQEYLERVLPERYPEARKNITITCITCLLFDVFKNSCLTRKHLEERVRQNPFFDYAARFWWIYPLEHEKPGVRDLALRFLMDTSKVTASADVIFKDVKFEKCWQVPLSGLHLVARLGLDYLAKLLLKSDAKVESRGDYGYTPLMWAANQGSEAMVLLLLENGADVEFTDDNGQTPLSLAAASRNEATAVLLLSKGADIESRDNEGNTPLSCAATSRKGRKIVGVLLEKGAEMESRNNRGQTTLIRAIEFASQAVVEVLVAKGANIESKDNVGRTPLLEASCWGDEAIIKLLLDRGADIESKDNEGRTPLSLALYVGDEAAISLLLARGADIEAKDNEGRTPLSLACGYGDEATIALLLARGADIEAKDNEGRTPLSWASENRNEAAIKVLLARGADIEAKDNEGRTILSRVLDGADIEVKDKEGRALLVIAPGLRNKAIVALLESARQASS